MGNTPQVEQLLKERYYLKDEQGNIVEDWEGLCRRIAGALSGDDLELREKLFEIYFNKEGIMGSPTLMNANARLGMLSSCFVYDIQDSAEDIFTVIKDCGMTFKKGGGIGLDLSKIRPAGSIVQTTRGYANGPVGLVMPLLNVTADVIKGGGLRKAAILAVLNASHPDILSFIDSKKKEGSFENMNVSVSLDKDFWDAYNNKQKLPLIFKDKKYSEIYPEDILSKIASSNWSNGEPGLIFLDTINKYNFTPHLGRITHANPCITGDSLIKTEKGDLPIKDLVGQNIKVWSLNKKTEIFELKNATRIIKTKKAKTVYKISLWNDMTIKATNDHKIFTNAGYITVDELSKNLNVIRVGYWTSSKVGFSQVISIEPIEGENVYDMSVADNHNFIANGIVVHNCGEFFSIPWNSCNLASINLNKFLVRLGPNRYDINWDKLSYVVKTMTKALDNTVDVNKFPISKVEEVTKQTRPLGLGVFGLANVLIKLGLSYASQEGRKKAKEIVEFVTYSSMAMSCEMASYNGSFPAFKGSLWDKVEENAWLQERLSDHDSQLNWRMLIDGIIKNGIRNSHNTIMMPTGSVSFICDSGESAGIEPIYKMMFKKLIVSNEHLGIDRYEPIYSSVAKEWLENNPGQVLPNYFIDAHTIGWEDQILMQAELQKVTHNGISKCISGDTLIETDKGFMYIDELSENRQKGTFIDLDIKVMTSSGFQDTSQFYYNGFEKNSIKITLEDGKELIGSKKHKVLFINKEQKAKWISLESLKKGQKILINIPKNMKLSEDN